MMSDTEQHGKEPPHPGDAASPGTVGTGDNVCPICRGTKTFNNEPCENCGGTGVVVEGVGGA